MEKPVLREYYVIDFYALYLVIRMPASWHVFADPVTYVVVYLLFMATPHSFLCSYEYIYEL